MHGRLSVHDTVRNGSPMLVTNSSDRWALNDAASQAVVCQTLPSPHAGTQKPQIRCGTRDARDPSVSTDRGRRFHFVLRNEACQARLHRELPIQLKDRESECRPAPCGGRHSVRRFSCPFPSVVLSVLSSGQLPRLARRAASPNLRVSSGRRLSTKRGSIGRPHPRLSAADCV